MHRDLGRDEDQVVEGNLAVGESAGGGEDGGGSGDEEKDGGEEEESEIERQRMGTPWIGRLREGED